MPPITPNSKVIDLCSGSGAIAISVAKNSNVKVFALEKYSNALEYLQKNIALNNANVEVIKQDLFEFIPTQKYDVIISNPPYIKTEELGSLQKEVQYEPMTALDGGSDGLIFYRHIAKMVNNLNSGGKIMVEIGYNQAEQVIELFKQNGLVTESVKDLNGVQRVIIGTLPY